MVYVQPGGTEGLGHLHKIHRPEIDAGRTPVLGYFLKADHVIVTVNPHQMNQGAPDEGQPFTYDLFDALGPSEFDRRKSWFAESSDPPNCCWAYGITSQFRSDSTQRDPSTV
jgi:hypothetical protein